MAAIARAAISIWPGRGRPHALYSILDTINMTRLIVSTGTSNPEYVAGYSDYSEGAAQYRYRRPAPSRLGAYGPEATQLAAPSH